MDKIKILVVDDESRMRKLVKDFLGKRRISGIGSRRRDGSNGSIL